MRITLRSLKRSCVLCRKRDATTQQPEMAELPFERTESQIFPFQNTGVDYFGPFEVSLLRRTMKRWICLFTCLSTRAVHLEVAYSLDTESCLAAINRFIARKGRPSLIISDNGTNFVGSAKELKQAIEGWNQQLIEERLAQDQIEWRFNPPGAPHFGGNA